MPRHDALPLQGRLPPHGVRRKALFSLRMTDKTKAPFGALAILPSHTASFAAFTGILDTTALRPSRSRRRRAALRSMSFDRLAPS